MKIKTVCSVVIAALLGGFVLYSGPVFAASAAKQLAKGIELYNDNKMEDAMDAFVDVLMNGTMEESAQANQYVNMIHNRIGGIQNPVEVAAGYTEGAVRGWDNTVANTVNQAQTQANTWATAQQQQIQQDLAAQQQAAQNAWNTQTQNLQNAVYTPVQNFQETVYAPVQNAQDALAELEAQERALNDQLEARRLQLAQQAAQTQDAVNAFVAQPVVYPAGTGEMTVADLLNAENPAYVDTTVQPSYTVQPMYATEPVYATQPVYATDPIYATQPVYTTQTVQTVETVQNPIYEEQRVSDIYMPRQENVLTTVGPATTSSAFADLTTPDAVAARNLYTQQKLDSMIQAAIDKVASEKGVHLYVRDGRPDAIDIDDGVVFQGTNFRTESIPLLNNIYELLALTQGAEYIILPPGSYTDDVNLEGIREAMALNSYFVKRGISQGKLYYNMGLVDKEAPAQFANLKGLSIVFDYDSKFPTRMQKNAENETAPLLSMAIVPQCHAIDRSLGEAYAIDFSVLETTEGLDNWVLQVVQHGRDGNYYIVRQLEGFAPVYHQILWNGRKGIIGPELPCGKYTIVLTAMDLKGNKQTLRRRVVVKCSSDQSDSITAFCGIREPAVEEETVTTVKTTAALNYKASRLWKKPGRTMGGSAQAKAKAAATAKTAAKATASESASDTSTYTVTKTVRNIVTNDTSLPAVATTGTTGKTTTTTTTTSSVSTADSLYGDMPADLPSKVNPYDMPYDEDF